MKYPNWTPPPSRRPFGGFSLVELLVVILIIVVLAAISFTVTVRAKASANMARDAGKMREIAAAIAVGRPLFNYPAGVPRRTLYVDFENDPRGDIRERLQAMDYGPDDLANLCYLSFPSMRGLDSEAGSLELGLSSNDLETLWHRTEGWAAARSIAAVWRDGAAFADNYRLIADLVVEQARRILGAPLDS